MATLATQQITPSGILDVVAGQVAAAGGGDKVRPGPNVYVEIVTVGTGTTVTIDDPNSRNPSGAVAGNNFDLVVVIGTNKRVKIGPLTAERFASPTDGLVAITYTSVVALTIGAYST